MQFNTDTVLDSTDYPPRSAARSVFLGLLVETTKGLVSNGRVGIR